MKKAAALFITDDDKRLCRQRGIGHRTMYSSDDLEKG